MSELYDASPVRRPPQCCVFDLSANSFRESISKWFRICSQVLFGQVDKELIALLQWRHVAELWQHDWLVQSQRPLLHAIGARPDLLGL